MSTTVYFATNRALAGVAETVASYGATMVTPSSPTAITYGTAFVDGADLVANVQAILAAGDCNYDTFDQPNLARLSGLIRLAGRISICYSEADHVLQLSMVVNLGAKRLGQDGPRNRTDAAAFPPAQYTMVDCTRDQDYVFDFLSSHQYYRQSPAVRATIAASMGR